MSKPRDRKNP